MKEHLQLILFQTFDVEGKNMFDITICNNDVWIGHAGCFNQQCFMLDTYIATVHNAREEFNDN